MPNPESRSPPPSRLLFLISSLATTVLYFAVGALAFGGWSDFFAHPARAGLAIVSLALAFAVSFSGVNFSRGKREDVSDRWIFLPVVAGSLLLAWLPPYMDRRAWWTLDGDTVRYVGLALFAVGGVLRIWPTFVLGHRFSAFVAIQPEHELVTDGIYGRIRHPSYLGALLLFYGWALVFRSPLAFVLTAPALWVLIARIDAEERLLGVEFGERYEAYRRRTWRLVPGVY